MPLPKSSLRLTASLMASLMLLILYFTFSSHHFAYAADVNSIQPEDHNHDRILQAPIWEMDEDELDLELEASDIRYEADFIGYDRGIIGRAPTGNEPETLENNRVVATNVDQGVTMQYAFLNASLYGPQTSPTSNLPSSIDRRGNWEEGDEEAEDIDLRDENMDEVILKPRQDSSSGNRTLYITVNACQQPTSSDSSLGPPPQLQLYISVSPNNTTPGPTQNSDEQQVYELVGGAWMVVVNASSDVYIGLFGPNVTGKYESVWNAEIAASIDAPYHLFHDSDPNLFLIDSDSTSALLTTKNLTTEAANTTIYQEWMDINPPPFVMFANQVGDASIIGLQNSYCGLQNTAQIPADKVQVGMTSRGPGHFPKEEFYFNGLDAKSIYYGILATNRTGSGTVGGGGEVWSMMNFTTLSDSNCAVIFDLEFCDEVAYAVPGNSQKFPNATSLAAFYDNSTQAAYTFFEKALAQIPCETTSSAQYSLARNCSDCDAAYKEWLCSVSIPRCTDFSSTLPWVRARNMGQAFPNGTMLDPSLLSFANQSAFLNSSRNPNIDLIVQPGPYKEILPCDDLCYNLVQSCPAAMGFGCPMPGDLGYNQSYGSRPDATQDGQITCNYPGAVYFLSMGSRSSVSQILAFTLAVSLSLVFI